LSLNVDCSDLFSVYRDARYSDVITMRLQQLLLYAESVAVVYQRQHHAGCQ